MASGGAGLQDREAGASTTAPAWTKGVPVSRIAFVLDQDFEDSEFQYPHARLREAGHSTVIVGKEHGAELRGKREQTAALVELQASEAAAADFDALVIPGGTSPDKLRTDPDVVRFVREMADAGKPVAAICHGGSLLIEARVVEGVRVTSWPSIRTDLANAGALWEDAEVVEDGNLITSREPGDLGAFTTAIRRRLGEHPA